MFIILSSLCLLYLACALLYQADDRRTSFAQVKKSAQIRLYIRSAAGGLLIISLLVMAPLQGWLRGVPIWLGLLSVVFVLGLFIAAQRPSWHAPSAGIAAIAGTIATLGALL